MQILQKNLQSLFKNECHTNRFLDKISKMAKIAILHFFPGNFKITQKQDFRKQQKNVDQKFKTIKKK
jgi:hypothetical protein